MTLFCYTVLVLVTVCTDTWALSAVGVYRFSRAATRAAEHVGGDGFRGRAVVGAVHKLHRDLRSEAVAAVVCALVVKALFLWSFSLLVGRLA